jgi:catechol 2,3-dioxygenase-like lactoylglutathione lyase family enzyme
MSRLFGKMFQVGYVVDDFDAAVTYWTRVLGAGPFFLYPTPIPFRSLRYYGQETTDVIHLQVALGYSGDIQIELIRASDAPSPYQDFVNAGGRGPQHFGFAADDFDAQVKAAVESGMTPVLEGELPGSRICYLATSDDRTMPMMELVDIKPERVEMFAKIKAASIGWDGSDPLRRT